MPGTFVAMGAIVAAGYLWNVFVIAGLLVLVGRTERVGQRGLLTGALWMTAAGVAADFVHAYVLSGILARVDFLLVAEPLPILLSALQLPAAIIMLAALVMSLGVWRLEAGESLLFSAVAAVLTAPWLSLLVPDAGGQVLSGQSVFAIAALLLVGALGPWALLGAGAWAADQGLDPRAAQAAVAVAAGVVVGLLATEAPRSRPVLSRSRSCPAASASPSATASMCRTAPPGSGRSWRRTRASPWPGRPTARGS